MIDRVYLQTLPVWKNIKIERMAFKIPIRGIGTQIHYSDEFAVLIFYLKGSIAITAITRELHVVDDLKVKMLLNTDIMSPEKMNLDFGSQQMTIGSCESLSIPFSLHARKQPNFKRTVRFKDSIVLSPGVTTNVPVNYHGEISENREFFFEPQLNLSHHLGDDGGVFAHIVDVFLNFVQIHNVIVVPIVISRRAKLKSIVEYNQEKCYFADPSDSKLAFTGWKNKTVKVAKATVMAAIFLVSLSQPPTIPASSVSISFTISTAVDFNFELTFPCGVTIYNGPPGGETVQKKITKAINSYPNIWRDSGSVVDVPKKQWMPINTKAGTKIEAFKVYPVGPQDREIIDRKFNDLHQQKKMQWTENPIQFGYLVFVVWKTVHLPGKPPMRKRRVVVDIRKLNKIAESDAYPMPFQSNIISAVQGSKYITVIDCAGFFHQWPVKREDRHKLTVVNHKGNEQWNVAVMGFKNNPAYVQK